MIDRQIFLYLARRDKSAVRIMAILTGQARTGRVHDLKALSLPPEIAPTIINEAHANRMLWEVWVEPAEDYDALKKRLEKRGYRNLPFSGQPVVRYIPGQSINSKSILNRNTMLRPNRKT